MATPFVELDVKLGERVFVKVDVQPGYETDTNPFVLTNIDQVQLPGLLQLTFTRFLEPFKIAQIKFTFLLIGADAGIHSGDLYFYAANPDKGSQGVAETLRNALGKMLIHYDFLAGRVRLNEEMMQMEIYCNNAGAQFLSALGDLTMEELGDVTVHNPLFRKFVPQTFNATTIADIPLMMIQVTMLTCGGHVIGFGMSHVVWDGHGVLDFLFYLMLFAQGVPLVFLPKPDPAMKKARDPPTPAFGHPEYVKLDELAHPTSFTTSNAATPEFMEIAAPAMHSTKIIPFSAEDLATLKQRLVEGVPLTKETTFEAPSGHVCEARMKAIDAEPRQLAQLLYVVDIQDHLEPALPTGSSSLSFLVYCHCLQEVFVDYARDRRFSKTRVQLSLPQLKSNRFECTCLT